MDRLKELFGIQGASDSGLEEVLGTLSLRQQELADLLNRGYSIEECVIVLECCQSLIQFRWQSINRTLHNPYWLRKMGLATTPLNDYASFEELGLSKRVRSALSRTGVREIADVKELAKNGRLCRLRQIGCKGQAEVLEKLAEYEKRDDKVENHVVSLD